jgi:hypothetical protein
MSFLNASGGLARDDQIDVGNALASATVATEQSDGFEFP